MKYQITSHAVDRWRERIDPGASYAEATATLERLMPTARQVGKTNSGEMILKVDHPSGAGIVVRTPRQRRDKAPGATAWIVVTVLTREQVERDTAREDFDPMAEMLEAYEEMQRRVPPAWTPRAPAPMSERHAKTMDLAEHIDRVPPHERDFMIARLVAVTEGARARVAHFEAEISGASFALESIGRIADHFVRGEMSMVAWWIERYQETLATDSRKASKSDASIASRVGAVAEV